MKYGLLILALLFGGSLCAQTANKFATTLYEQSEAASKAHATENVYLRTSKEVYETGEDLWFYTRILNSQTHTVSDESQILFVELRSVDGQSAIHREMYKVENGFVSGHLFLPDSLQAGEYRISAITANSLKHKSAPMESSRRLLIRKEIVPHILIQTSFDKPFYEDAEPVEGVVRLLRANGDAIADARAIISLKQADKTIKRVRTRTDSSGRASFNLDHNQQVASLQLQVRVSHKGEEERHEQAVPFDPMSKVQLQFLPEGGHAVAGMNSHIAFKAVDRSGMPVEIKQATVFANDKPMLDIRTEHAGMGSFNLFGDSETRYTVRVTEPAIDSVYVLPDVKPEGVRFFVQRQTEETLMVGLRKSMGFDLDWAYLAVKQRGIMMWGASAEVDNEGQLFKIPKKELQNGIAELTLYNKEKEPLASRLVFVGQQKQLRVSVTHSSENYGVKEQVTFKLKVEDKEGKPVQSALALALNDEIFASPFAEKNIISHFLLETELKGRLFEPSYYFEKPNADKLRHLDLLLMTQGWRAYEWNTSALEALPNSGFIQLLDIVMGQVDRKTLPGRLRKASVIPVQLISKEGAMEVYTDSLGRFPITSGILAVSEGTDIISAVTNAEQAGIDFISAFDHAESILAHNHTDHGLRHATTKGRNWNVLPQAQADAQEVMGVTVVDQQDKFGKFNGQDGHYVGNSRDYVCQYSILNCRNHRFGTSPVPGQIYRIGGRWVVYEMPVTEVYANTLKGYYKSPRFYQPEYDVKPEEKLIPDFRNTLVWEPLIITDENGEAIVQFFTSDIRSVFNGWVEGIGVNGQFGLVKFDVNVLK